MKHFSRLLALLLAVALLPLTFMAAASAEEPVTITIWGSDRENMPFRNGLWTIDVLQEKLGIKIEIISAPTESLAEKYGLLIASGELPTIRPDASYNPVEDTHGDGQIGDFDDNKLN